MNALKAQFYAAKASQNVIKLTLWKVRSHFKEASKWPRNALSGITTVQPLLGQCSKIVAKLADIRRVIILRIWLALRARNISNMVSPRNFFFVGSDIFTEKCLFRGNGSVRVYLYPQNRTCKFWHNPQVFELHNKLLRLCEGTNIKLVVDLGHFRQDPRDDVVCTYKWRFEFPDEC